ncbi:DUF4270 domain-containing protein [Fulvivirga sp. M361]|uniref:DUF4270 family protein n=1 Tax=Fulvivirga sp. M361 TaxID=2594266 RepID=UPI00117B2F33|nr:DUF4270 family protein [Fulvivirga sp. M361]TRX59114.1 DUF4270 domain-containing protein [Fulvivirga sp. M361]
MNKIVVYVGLATVPFWLGKCNFPTPLGEEIVQSEILDIVFIDTIDVRLSTVISDSIVTSNTDRHLIGTFRDDEIGRITSSSLFGLSLDSLEFPDEGATYLSAEFELFHDGYFYYDTSQNFTIELYPLKDVLELDDDGFLYNVSGYDYQENTRLGALTFVPRPSRNKTISIPVDDEYGSSIFNLALTEDQNDFLDDFEDRYPGLALVADTSTTQSFLGFATTSRLIINYRLSGEDFEMILSSNGIRYNKISNDRSKAALADLVTREEDITSLQTNNRSYLHNSVGMFIKLEIPFLRDIREVLNDNFITEATLVLRPVKDTYSNVRPLPAGFTFYEVDRLNRIEQVLGVAGVLNFDDEFKEDTEYRILITDFIQQKIDEDELTEDAIMVSGTSDALGTTADQLVLGDSFSEYDVSLELFILDYSIGN